MRALDWFIARRYLASRKKGRFLSLITWISLGGITVGVTALIVVLGVMNGMQEEIRGKILGSTPHVLILEHGSSLRMAAWPDVAAEVREVDGVEAVQPFIVSRVALLRSADYAQTADFYGVSLDADTANPVTDIERDFARGNFDLEVREGEPFPVVLGSRLASRMGIVRGDTIQVVSLERFSTSPYGHFTPSVRRFEVRGTFSTGMYEYDMEHMYAPLEVLQGFLGLAGDDVVSGLGVRVDRPERATDLGHQISDILGPRYYAESWTVSNQALFAALELEKIAMGIILFLIVIVAAFNIVSTLVMVVVERTPEIGILKSMGMTDGGILRIFLLQGVSIGVLGTLLGTGFGLLLSWILHRYQIVQIPPDVYFIDRLPVSVHASDVLLIAGGSILISLVATIYPSLQASRLQPVEAIRHE